MSFPRYPDYKDSGMAWLGEVPGHWEVQPFKHQIERNDGGVWGEDPEGINDTIVLRSTEQTVDGYWKLDDPAPRKLSESEICGSLLAENDLLLTKSSGSSLHIGKTTLVTAEIAAMRCCYSNFMQRIRMKSTFLPKLAWHVMNNDLARLQFDLLSNSSTGLANLNATMVGQIVVPVPPLPEQTQIAAFLDRETAKIDALVAEQRRLMALLKEKRQAVISHAVTRGLNPHAPMKPSGIEWLGDVSAHREVLKGALIGALFGSEQVPEDAVLDEGDLPFIKVGSLSRDSFEIESWDHFVDRTVAANCTPRSGYIVFPKRGAAIFTNKVNIVDRPSLIDPNLMGWQIGERAVTTFIAYALKCRKLDELADVSTVPQINNKHIAPERFAVPPIDEQRQIVAYLIAESAKFDTLTTEAQRAIDLLQERRTALISAAVTGQIDVRGAV